LGRSKGEHPIAATLMDVIFLRAAEGDVQNIYERLDADRGEKFLSTLDDTVGHLRRFPQIGRVYSGKYRRLLLPNRYPHAIIYVVESNRIVIHAVFDLRQNPEKLIERLR
jgi:plasmid stabilization system protein ParE